MRIIYLTLMICLILIPANKGVAQDAPPPCPALPTPQLKKPAHQFGPLDGAVIDPTMANDALEVVGRFESGRRWNAIGTYNLISLGYLQWNWGAPKETLFKELFTQITPEAIALAGPSLQSDLLTLKAYSDALTGVHSPDISTKKKAAQSVIKNWIIQGSQPSVKSSVKANLSKWLDRPELRKIQRSVIDRFYLGPAFAYARQWHDDTKSQKPVDARLVTYFFDLTTFSGDPHKVWAEHVAAFRSPLLTPEATLKAAIDWLSSCKDFKQELGRIDDAIKTASYWQEKLDHHESLDDDQINLLVLGLLVAQRSTGVERGVKGYFQADVLTRRGIIMLGGYVGGKRTPDVMPKH